MKILRATLRLSLLSILLAGSGTASAAAGPIPICGGGGANQPAVVGPIAAEAPGQPSRNYPWAATDKGIAQYGYVEEEFFFCGKPLEGAYTSRMIVRRPATAERFNGTVVVEWLNVTAGSDADLLWLRSYEHLLRSGYAYVGVSAQGYGVYPAPNGLKVWSPERYGQLVIPNGANSSASVVEPAAYAIFSQALRALRTPAGARPLGPLAPQALIVTGGSLSANTVTAHYQLYQPLERLADGYLPFISSIASSVAFLDSTQQINVQYPVFTRLVRTPYFLVNSETDPSFLRNPDGPFFRLWEVAGTSHVDQDHYLSNRPLRLRDAQTDLGDQDANCAHTPRSRIPFKYALNAALDHLNAWVRSGVLPPSAPTFEYNLLGQLKRDADGNVLGGIRLPQHAVPTAVNRRENSGSALCSLYGRHQPWDAATLRARYPTHAQYAAAVSRAADAAELAGFLVPADAALTRQQAEAAAVPP